MSTTKWIKVRAVDNLIFLGAKIIAIASGLHIIFINLNTKEEKVEKFSDKVRGDGATCLAGHSAVSMFAVAERRINPKISLFTYPEMVKVSICAYKKLDNFFYLSIKFFKTDYLIGLVDFPNFELIIWHWKSGEIRKIVNTRITDDFQQIQCSPVFFSQNGRFSGQFSVYEMGVCSKKILLTEINNFNVSERVVWCSWTCEGNLILCNERGDVFLASNDGKCENIVINTDLSGNKPAMAVEFQRGIAIVTTPSKIHLYRKIFLDRGNAENSWTVIWEVILPSHPIYLIRHPRRDSLLVSTIQGEVLEVTVADDNTPKTRIISLQTSKCQFLTPINPRRHFIVTIDSLDRLIIFESLSGNFMSALSLEIYGKCTDIAAHPRQPLIATTTDSGRCLIINASDTTRPTVVQLFYLSGNLDKIKFSYEGNILTAATAASGEFFIIKDSMNIQCLKTPRPIVDYLVFEKAEKITMLVLVRHHRIFNIGQYLLVYNLDNSTGKIEEFLVELPNFFNALEFGATATDVLMTPYLTKQLYSVKIEENGRNVRINEAVSISHRLRDVKVCSDAQFILTFGYDGLIIIRSCTNIQQSIVQFSSHHRHDRGVKFAFLCSAHNIIVSLGNNGDLVATKVSRPTLSSVSAMIEHIEVVDEFISRFCREINSGDENIPWIDCEREKKLKIQELEAADTRLVIENNFQLLKKKLKKLLDENESELTNAQLPIVNFDLDRVARVRKMELFHLKLIKIEKSLKEKLFYENKVIKYLEKLWCDSMAVSASNLMSLDGKIRVENFPLTHASLEGDNGDSFQTFSDNFNKLVPNFPYDLHDPDNLLALRGTTTYRWIDDKLKNSAYQIRGVGDSSLSRKIEEITKIHEKELKCYFNELFAKMQVIKEEEIKKAKDRIFRMNHCLEELKQMFQVDCDDYYNELPLYNNDKSSIINNISLELINNTDSTINSSENVDNSSLLKSNNYFDASFREEELEKMMDGALQVRWEDEIKKDIVIPDCLLKNPEDYTEDDLIMLENYEKAKENLLVERFKYKLMLESEISELQETLRTSVSNLNSRIKEFFLQRIKLNSAILQETLMRLRESQQDQLQIHRMNQLQHLQTNDLNTATHELQNLLTDLVHLESTITEIRGRYENLIKRDKLLENKFRGEFPDLKQPMLEHLLRHYKKRPRIGQLVCTSITYLTEISKCILSGEKSNILPRDCLDFLKGINTLDIMPTSLPSQIDSSHWYLVCRLRRTKIEIEIRIKSCALELAEAEQTISNHQRQIQIANLSIQSLRERIDSHEHEESRKLLDLEVQLVLKMEQVEINLTGHLKDFERTIFVGLDEVSRVNQAIVDAGRKKLGAMNLTITLRRKIEWREWRHSCLKMTLKDMEVELKVLQAVKVTKEIQNYLVSCSSKADGDIKISDTGEMSVNKRWFQLVTHQKDQLNSVLKQVDDWIHQNDQLARQIQQLSLAKIQWNELNSTLLKSAKFSDGKFRAIMKRNRVIKKIKNNYEDLLSLRTQLELLRLKTYPTLRSLKHINDRDEKLSDN